ncbi:Rpn family recombination-promoting nuclease/putative transposase [Nostoc sp. CHAB 5836]|uniref:Rpn family recombination-promoting nuclease/putative transposase n=1 Tax=Nostoc sp. CHAB 5836 TaxID=2780404 RepID=UPI002810B003|nr:Rpn family recombination-promoting nuclease/putative transposase [Nostoc sp. CHAB 5836]MCC5615604.1 Rpn family recombination-promoting nuclease/putative transposase [Nostoc sp. CHAB 5836]
MTGYKFVNLSREEIEAMFEITLQETRVYREAKQEGLELGLELGRQEGIKQGREQAKRELIPRCLAYGIPIEEVARILNLTIEQVEQIRLASEQKSSTLT